MSEFSINSVLLAAYHVAGTNGLLEKISQEQGSYDEFAKSLLRTLNGLPEPVIQDAMQPLGICKLQPEYGKLEEVLKEMLQTIRERGFAGDLMGLERDGGSLKASAISTIAYLCHRYNCRPPVGSVSAGNLPSLLQELMIRADDRQRTTVVPLRDRATSKSYTREHLGEGFAAKEQTQL